MQYTIWIISLVVLLDHELANDCHRRWVLSCDVDLLRWICRHVVQEKGSISCRSTWSARANCNPGPVSLPNVLGECFWECGAVKDRVLRIVKLCHRNMSWWFKLTVSLVDKYPYIHGMLQRTHKNTG